MGKFSTKKGLKSHSKLQNCFPLIWSNKNGGKKEACCNKTKGFWDENIFNFIMGFYIGLFYM